MSVSGSDDGKTWTELGRTGGMARPTRRYPSVASSSRRRRKTASCRLAFSDPRARQFHVNEISLFRNGKPGAGRRSPQLFERVDERRQR